VALTILDPDAVKAPNHLAIHWIFYDVPSTITTLPDGVSIGSAGYPGFNGQNTKGAKRSALKVRERTKILKEKNKKR